MLGVACASAELSGLTSGMFSGGRDVVVAMALAGVVLVGWFALIGCGESGAIAPLVVVVFVWLVFRYRCRWGWWRKTLLVLVL